LQFLLTVKIVFKMKSWMLLVALWLTGVVAMAQYKVYGKITDESGTLLPGAVVKLDEWVMAADENGHYQFENIKVGEHLLEVSFIGYADVVEKVVVINNLEKNVKLEPLSVMADEVIVRATRATSRTPLAFSNVSKSEIASQNMGQDLPFLIAMQPSVVVNSDAGTGVGYTGFRIRGSDANRINVTVNGIPLNDAESHGVFWVNMPDFASSLDNIQIQRGVGTSTNGAAAFGASVNMQTNGLELQPYAEIANAYGSFNTLKNTVKVGTGLLNQHFTFDARLSSIISDGYIDRATSDLKSYYLSGGYYSANTIIRANVFSGKEKTYQAWTGVPKVRLDNDLEGMQRYENHWLYSPQQTQEMINSDSRTYNFYTYDNETDNYQQDHYQLLLSQKIGGSFNLNAALHYTYGRGYYEQYRANDSIAVYGMKNVIVGQNTITRTDLVRQKWLDNDFYGGVASVSYQKDGIDASIGGGWNRYDGRHYGKVIWAQYLGDNAKDFEWYRGTGIKTDYNAYSKVNVALFDKVANVYADIQLRHIKHEIGGIDDDLRDLTQKHHYTFFNPKVGVFVTPNDAQQIYLSMAVAHREPNRSNFTDADPNGPQPKPERLLDFELGYKYRFNNATVGFNIYDMEYHNQLVLTGLINDVGSAIMTNVKDSYRRGIELMAGYQPVSVLEMSGNLTLSDNKILKFTEYVDNWDNGAQNANDMKSTDIAFSPNVTASGRLSYKPFKGFVADFVSQYVGRQFIDNTSSSDRQLDAYWVNNLHLSYTVMPKLVKSVEFSLAVNNIFNEEYEANAWVYSYMYEGQRWAMDGYFPMAGINFMGGITIKF
jgi:iron complex outermembrane receptor protein